MSYLIGILLLASVLALGQAAPVSSSAQFYPYRVPFNKLSELAEQQSVDTGKLLRALGDAVDVLNQPRASEQLARRWIYGENMANAENSFNYGDAARAVGGLIDAFNQQQANQEAVANKETEVNAERVPWGPILTGAGVLLGG